MLCDSEYAVALLCIWTMMTDMMQKRMQDY